MNVEMIASTRVTPRFWLKHIEGITNVQPTINDSKVIALTAIRTCYSHLYPTQIVEKEGDKYLHTEATDGEGGTEADRLFRHITRSGHTSTLEHINYTFAIEGVSRSLLAQLTRHRHFSFSVQSQRYVRFGSEDKAGGFEHITPGSVKDASKTAGWWVDDRSYEAGADTIYSDLMIEIQRAYDALRECGVPAEDARMVLPNAAACNMVMTGNLRSLLDFYAKRQKGKGAQWEIAELAERIKDEVVSTDPWLKPYFEEMNK